MSPTDDDKDAPDVDPVVGHALAVGSMGPMPSPSVRERLMARVRASHETLSSPGHPFEDGDRRFFVETASYVLGALDPADRVAFEAHLAGCAECAAEVRALRPVADALGRMTRPQDPRPETRAALLSAVNASRRSAGQQFSALPAWLAAAAALVIAAGAAWYAVTTERAAEHDRLVTAVLAAPDLARIDLAGQAVAPSAAARAYWSRSRGLVLTASNLPALPAGRTYQLWVLTKDPAPMNAGLLKPDRDGRLTYTLVTPVDMPNPVAMAVTLEPEGGVPAPTGEKYLVGVAN